MSFSKTTPLSSSFSMLPLANPLLKHKVAQNILNDKQNASILQSKLSISSKLKKRKLKPILNIEPELAAKVVKSYLLPMFECKSRLSKSNQSHSSKKSLEMNRSHADLFETRETSAETSVYGELKLSEKLMNEIERLKIEVEECDRKMRDSEQTKITSESELCVLRSKYEDLQANFELLKFQLEQHTRSYQKIDLKVSYLSSQLEQYKNLLSNSESKVEEASSNWLNERMINDRLKAELQKLAHFNDLIEMQNQIMGDRLRGLQNSIEELSSNRGAEEVLISELKMFLENGKKLAFLDSQLMIEMKILKEDKETISNDLIEMTELKNFIKNDRDKFVNRAKDRITQMKNELTKEINEKDKMQSKYEEMKTSFDLLSEQYDRVRDKITSYKVNRNGEIEEKVCNNCKKFFLESENFNWSCSIHGSQYSGQI